MWSETAGEDENGWVFVDMTFARDVAVECGAVTQNKMQLVRTVDTVVGSAVNVVMQPWSPVDDAEESDGEVVEKLISIINYLLCSFYHMTEYSQDLILLLNEYILKRLVASLRRTIVSFRGQAVPRMLCGGHGCAVSSKRCVSRGMSGRRAARWSSR